MNYKRIENILLYFLLVLVAVVYLYTLAPTVSFWDCGEFIASAFTLAVPHPPGTPFYIVLGRVWLIIVGLVASVLPISKEVAWHMNLLGLGLSVGAVFLMYRMLLKIFRMWYQDKDQLTIIIITFATCLATAFFYTVWGNAIETEVYAASTFVALLVNYLALLWYESVKQGNAKNQYVLLAFYLIFLSTGIHLTPFLMFVPFYIFVFFVEREYTKDILFILLGIFQMVVFALTFLLPQKFYTAALILIGLVFLMAIVLVINNSKRYHNWRFFWMGVLLVIIGMSTELYLPIRARRLMTLYQDDAARTAYLAGENIAPRINECDPGRDFKSFNEVLHRAQYGPTRLIPRQTQDETGFNLIEGVFWQFALFVRYLSWQPIPEDTIPFLRFVVLFLFYAFTIWGMVELYRREKRVFLFMILIMFMLSFAMLGYLNLKFSPTDGNPKHQPREVRERDYFFHTGHVYFGLFMGLGFFGFIDWLSKGAKQKNLMRVSGLSSIVVFSLVPLVTNIRVNNRYGNFIPRDYGYNMLVSCDDSSLVFTNGDNDTFPLWFVQEVLGVKRSVIVANLSLINTPWYIRQLKYWGAPVSFSDEEIDVIEPVLDYRNRRVIYVKDIMIRDIIATNAGIKLKRRIERGKLILSEAFFISQEEFAQRYVKGYRGRNPVYFASTVSSDNDEGFRPYLKLEGLVYRLVGDSIDYPLNIDLQKTQDLFYKIYRYRGIFEPKKQELLVQILPNFQERKKRGEFYNFSVVKDENTVRLYSNYAAGLFNLGLAVREIMDLQSTINAWRFAVLFEPYPIYPFLYNIGLLYAQTGHLDSAYVYFSQIETKDPQILVQIGMMFNSMGEPDRAIEYMQKAMTINPQFPGAYYGLFNAYMTKNDTASAIAVLQNWLSINPQDSSASNMIRELSRR